MICLTSVISSSVMSSLASQLCGVALNIDSTGDLGHHLLNPCTVILLDRGDVLVLLSDSMSTAASMLSTLESVPMMLLSTGSISAAATVVVFMLDSVLAMPLYALRCLSEDKDVVVVEIVERGRLQSKAG